MEGQGQRQGMRRMHVAEIDERFALRCGDKICRLLLCKYGTRHPGRRPSKRFVHGGVQEQDFQYGKTHCLSSYYSVFVARLAIMVMLAILIGLLTILTWHFTTVYTTKSIKSLAKDLRSELLQRPVLRMWNILNSTVEITMAQVKLSEYVIGSYKSPVNYDQQLQMNEDMRDITWALFASRKALNAITISYYNGHVMAFHKDHKNNNTFYIFNEPANVSSSNSQHKDVPISPVPRWSDISSSGSHSAIWYREPLDPITGENRGPPKQIPPDDLINIAGISEIHDGAASWHVTVSKFTDSPLLSAALPIRHPTEGSIAAVVGVTTALSSVGQLMRELVNSHTGYMYLTSQEGYLLATSTNASLLRKEIGGLKLMMAVESNHPIIRAGAEWLQKEYGNSLPFNKEVHVENVMLGQQRYYIDSFFLNLKRLPSVGVIIIPRSYVMGKVDRRGYATLVILISASVCILVIGCICILILTSGVSKEMKLRAELISHLDARRRAEASNNYKSQFLANMSHELRTPMAAVIGLLDILICDECLTTEQISTISQIRRCSTALLRLLNNILDLSKVESGKLVLEETEFDLGRELEGLMDMFSVQCINHNVETVLDLADDMPRIVRGDSARVVQIFANLISNSMKFTSSGHITLRGWCENSLVNQKMQGQLANDKDSWYLKTFRSLQPEKRTHHDEEKTILWFEVEDTGCGIDSSKWELVFESFEQADPSTTRTYGGTGLGLCIVRTLVNKMGGQIKVVRKEGPGTLMRLYLVFGTTSEKSGQLSQHIHIEFDKKNLMVLLALDGTMSRLTMTHWLKENDIQVFEASGWTQMVEILSKFDQYDYRGGREALNLDQLEDGFNYRDLVEQYHSKECPGNKAYHNNNQIPHDEFDCQPLRASKLIVILDVRLLDLTENAWKGQIFYLMKYQERVKFAWLLNHDTPTIVKLELWSKGHSVMVNRPLYKSKLNHMLATITREFRVEQEKPISSSQSSDIQLNSGVINIDSTMHSAQVGWSEMEAAEELIGNSTQKHYFHKIPENLYFNRHGSFTSSTERTAFFPYPMQRLTGLVSPSECLIKSEYNILQEKFENSKMCEVKEVIHETNNNNEVCNECCDGSIYPEFKSKMSEKNSFRRTRQPEVLAESSNCKQSDSYALELQQASGQKETSWDQNLSAEASVMEGTRTSSNISGLSGSGLSNKQFREQSLIQTSRDKDNEGLDGINNFPIPEISSKQPFCMPLSNGICKQNALEGIRILLAEDTPVLQRVATIMLEKMGASVVAVGDGLQAVDALKCMYRLDTCGRSTGIEESPESISKLTLQESPVFDLILMDCQMPKLDGYEATKTIRRVEEETLSHIPIVALTAHAMSSDEAKCLEVGMDAYLTKPIDCKQMVSTILSLTQRKC